MTEKINTVAHLAIPATGPFLSNLVENTSTSFKLTIYLKFRNLFKVYFVMVEMHIDLSA